MTLRYTHFPAGEKGFFRAPVLIMGPREAMLIDGGFTYWAEKVCPLRAKLSPLGFAD